MTALVIDTHVFLWWAEASSRIRSEWVEVILDQSNEVHLSAVSGWEIDTKRRLNKLDFDGDVARVAAAFGFTELAVTMEHATLAGRLDWDHRDPFDRMLVAQAIVEGAMLLTADDVMKSAPGVRVL